MAYVMVPVPEEHVEEVMQFVLRAMERASIEPWDLPSISAVFAEVDEASRSLLAYVSKATMDGAELSDADAARQVQLTVREIAGIMNEIQSMVRAKNRLPLVRSRVVEERLPNGRVKEKRVLQMDLDVAEFLRTVQAEELRSAPHPLAGSTE